MLTLVRPNAIATMHSILGAISTEKGTKGLRSLGTSSLGVGRADKSPPGSYCIDSNEFHANDNITSDERLQVGEERLALVLTIENLRSVAIETRHLKLINLKATALNSTDDRAHLSVAIRLDHSESALARRFEISAGVDVTIVHDSEHTRENSDLSSDIKVFKRQGRLFTSLEELTVVLDIEHLNRSKARVEVEAVGPNDLSLLVIPLCLESVLLLSKGRCLLHRDSQLFL